MIRVPISNKSNISESLSNISNKVKVLHRYGDNFKSWAQEETNDAVSAVDVDIKDLMNISVVINGKVFKANLIEELKIDKDDLNTCFIEQPGKYAWWAVLSELAQSKTDLAKAEVERLEGVLDEEIRNEMIRNGEKPTEDRVKRRIKNHTNYIQANRYYLDCKKISNTLDQARRSFDHRKESLISIGANERSQNSNTDVKILELKEKARAIVNSNE